jgi:hypothetical protein
MRRSLIDFITLEIQRVVILYVCIVEISYKHNKARLCLFPKAVIQKTIQHVTPRHLDVKTLFAIASFRHRATGSLVEHRIYEN